MKNEAVIGIRVIKAGEVVRDSWLVLARFTDAEENELSPPCAYDERSKEVGDEPTHPTVPVKLGCQYVYRFAAACAHCGPIQPDSLFGLFLVCNSGINVLVD